MQEHAPDDLSVIEPLADEVIFAGKKRKITPIKVGQLPRFTRAFKGIGMQHVQGLANGDPAMMFDLIAEHGDNVIEAVTVASCIDRKEVEGAELDELVMLAAVVMRVNANFFVHRLLPAIRQAAAQAKATSGDGLTPSMP